MIDSQSVKSAAGVNDAVGYDAGKQIKGRKRFLAVETLGLVMTVFVTAASPPERDGAKTLLARVKALAPQSIQRLVTIWADGGFSGDNFLRGLMDTCRWVVQVVLRPQQMKGFQVLKKRWVVERTFEWLMRCRRLCAIMSSYQKPQKRLSTSP